MPSSEGPPPLSRTRTGSATTDPADLGTGNPHSLHQAVYARREEYTRPHRIRVKVGTWNVAACPGTDKDLASWFVDGKGIDTALATLDLNRNAAIEGDTDGEDGVHILGRDKIGLYVLGLQEVVDLNTASQYVSRVYAGDEGVTQKWKTALDTALPPGYKLVASEHMTGLLLLIYASPEVAPTISNVSTVSVGTGLLGYMGNKGAVVTRIILGESTRLVFVNCHLASGIEATYNERRIWDVGQILGRTRFKPVSFAGVSEDYEEKIGDEDFTFWFGDLNFRLDGLPGDDIRHLLMLHTKGEYGAPRPKFRRDNSLEGEPIIVHADKSSDAGDETNDGNSTTTRSTGDTKATDYDSDSDLDALPDPDDFLPDPHDDPTSLQATLDSLLPHDQLTRLIKQKKVFHDGWHEGTISFLPSYKYDVGTVGLFDSSEKRRAPSWCDRILYRTRKDKEAYDKKIKEAEDARRKDEEMKARGIDQAGDDDEVLFDYDPDNDGDDDHSPDVSRLEYDEYDEGEEGDDHHDRDDWVDRIRQDIYTSHQRITSSDHKPIISIFTLNYDAVVPDLKAKVHAEVAWELDRAENEGRPSLTVVNDSRDARGPGRPGGSQDSAEELVDFGEVRFLRKQSATLTLANTGRVACTFSFVQKPSPAKEDGPILPPWLKTSFISSEPAIDDSHLPDLGKEVTLEPGETVRAQLQVYVNHVEQARVLNSGRDRLEEVLILRVADGRDHFIPVRGVWMPTCIGRSIDELIRVPEGSLRKFVHSLTAKNSGKVMSVPEEMDVHCAAPRELFKLTEALESVTERVLADEQMLEEYKVPRASGWPFEEDTWRVTDKSLRASRAADLIDALDEGMGHVVDAFSAEVPAVERIETVAEVLKLFLRGLTDGIITTSLWSRIEQASLVSLGQGAAASSKIPPQETAYEQDKGTVLDILSTAPNHNISFVFLTATLAKVTTDLSPITKSDLELLKSDTPVRLSMLNRRSLTAGLVKRNTSSGSSGQAMAAMAARQAKERSFAEVFGELVCRAPVQKGMKDKERKAVEEKQQAVLELFLRRRGD